MLIHRPYMTHMYTLKKNPTNFDNFDAFSVKNYGLDFWDGQKSWGPWGGQKKKNPLKKNYTGVRGSRNVDPKPQKPPGGVF